MANKVLVIDDDPDTLSLIRCILQRGGFEVFTYNSGRRAWEEILRIKPDLLILDVVLPCIDGYSLALRITWDDRTKDIPIIVLTALECASLLFKKFHQLVKFMPKPFENKELLETAKNAVSRCGKFSEISL